MLNTESFFAMESEFLGFWRVIRRWSWLILLLMVATIGAIIYKTYTAPPIYRARVQLRIIPSEPGEVSLFTQVRFVAPSEQVNQTREDFILFAKSRRVAWQTIADLDLPLDADALLDRVTIIEQGDFLTIVAQAPRPSEAEGIATQLVQNALNAYREFRLQPSTTAGQFIRQQLEAEREVLAGAQDAFLKFKLVNNVESLSREIQAYQDMLRNLRLKRDQELAEIERAKAQAEAYDAAADAAAKAAATAEATALTYRTRLALLDLKKKGKPLPTPMPGATPYPTPEPLTPQEEQQLTLAEDEAAAQRRAERAFRQRAAEARATVAGDQAAQARFDEMIAQREADLSRLIGLQEDYDRLQDAVAEARRRVDFLAEKANEAALKTSQGLNVGYLQVVEPARTPEAPVPPPTFRLLAVGISTSLLGGIVLAFLLEFLTMARAREGRRGLRVP
ncbi:MAG TPA: hypothetical protein EYH31_07965 [Anaerolineae bacterium]|nr:hypothetical protein [Anaerolineae bacterium]